MARSAGSSFWTTEAFLKERQAYLAYDERDLDDDLCRLDLYSSAPAFSPNPQASRARGSEPTQSTKGAAAPACGHVHFGARASARIWWGGVGRVGCWLLQSTTLTLVSRTSRPRPSATTTLNV
jgi:hypothetical protein